MFGENLLSTIGAVLGLLTLCTTMLIGHPAGDVHRRQRKMLNPVFSIMHMRHMLPVFYGVVHRVRDQLERSIPIILALFTMLTASDCHRSGGG